MLPTPTAREHKGGGKTGYTDEERTNSNEQPERHDNDGYWENFPTVSPIRDGDDGVPSRLVRSAIEAGGNAIVPQVAFEIFKAIALTGSDLTLKEK